MKKLKELPRQNETTELRSIASRLASQQTRLQKLHCLHDAIVPLKDKPTLSETSELVELLNELIAVHKRALSFAAMLNQLKTVEHVPKVKESQLGPVSDLLAEQTKVQMQIVALKSELQRVENEWKIANEAWQAFVKQHPECPTCGGKLDRMHIHDKSNAPSPAAPHRFEPHRPMKNRSVRKGQA
ncbi:MAG: hypothetical protein R3C03_12905 [Pirellulaceae bacterium]